ncbi:MAG: DUF4434 domain-containing protein [Pedobacter sp.]|uniref:DUF4434 domain-containing protein n=1 Tax=Pedobacter sp. TaxID=1411316 RepID=UPI0035696C48
MKQTLLILFTSILTVLSATAQTKTVKGTWINLAYQDVRNKYTNPAHVDYTSPSFWNQKIKEYSEMGISYLIIMAVANERKSYYPSDFMEPAYPSNRESPIEVIMRTADSLDLKVFMSCGWAINQYDDRNTTEVPLLQQRIMMETAAKFGKSKSFYGWYLPIEDGLFPNLSDQAVDFTNMLTAEGKRLIPSARVMISPYGLWMAEVDSDKFAAQIRKLKVDIVAYQDEVGCVREPFPIKKVKQHLETLGKIHQGTAIEFWTNVESFTWEKGTNSIESALIPAAFPRYLSQIIGATQAGAKEIVSFAMYGIYDKPDSNMPIGQPYGSAKAYIDYMDWRAGKGRWPWLEATFKGSAEHDAIRKKVDLRTPPLTTHQQGSLSDNLYGTEDTKDKRWTTFKNGKMTVVIDLDEYTTITNLAARFLHYRKEAVVLPSTVTFYLSKDGKKYERIKSVPIEISKNDQHDCWIDMAFVENIAKKTRYIKVEAEGEQNTLIMCDELLVNMVK